MEQWNNGTTAQANLANEKVTLRQKVVVPVGRGPKFLILLTSGLLLTSRQQDTRQQVNRVSEHRLKIRTHKHNLIQIITKGNRRSS
jgi:hypothetical protein